MKKIPALIASLMLLATAGCMNIYTRCPGTDREIASCYQSTRWMGTMSVVVAFPQIMSPGASDSFYWENIITIPCGLVCLADTACEAVLDTVCLPFDYPIACCRNGGGQDE